jgi:hypothetical protein
LRFFCDLEGTKTREESDADEGEGMENLDEGEGIENLEGVVDALVGVKRRDGEGGEGGTGGGGGIRNFDATRVMLLLLLELLL